MPYFIISITSKTIVFFMITKYKCVVNNVECLRSQEGIVTAVINSGLYLLAPLCHERLYPGIRNARIFIVISVEFIMANQTERKRDRLTRGNRYTVFPTHMENRTLIMHMELIAQH